MAAYFTAPGTSASTAALWRFGLAAATLCLLAGCPPTDPPVASDGGGLVLDLDAGTDPEDAGEEPETDAGTDPVLDAGEVQDDAELAARLCEVAARATILTGTQQEGPRCSPDDALDDPAVSGSEADLGTTCLPGAPLYDQAYAMVTGGRVSIDMGALEACLSAARAARAQYSTLGDLDARTDALAALLETETCADAINPLQGEGDPCEGSYECTGELACEANPPDGVSTTCSSPAGLNEACANAAPGRAPIRTCAEGLACFNDLCVEPRAEDSACGPSEVPCADGLVCGAAGLCQTPVPAGETCVIDADCVAGARCLRAACTFPLDDGEACESGDSCARPCSSCRTQGVDAGSACAPPSALGGPCASSLDCEHGLFCDADGLCTETLEFGAACTDLTPCAAGLTCSVDVNATVADAGVADGGAEMPTCRSPAPVGSACMQGTVPCAGGACVNGSCLAGEPGDACGIDLHCADENICVESVCQVPPRQAAPCAADGRCALGLYCDGARCQEYPAAGEACAPGDRCADDAFCGAEQMCEAKRSAGGMCADDAQCLSGACLLSGTCGAETASCAGGDRELTWFLLFGALWPLRGWRRTRRELAEGGELS